MAGMIVANSAPLWFGPSERAPMNLPSRASVFAALGFLACALPVSAQPAPATPAAPATAAPAAPPANAPKGTVTIELNKLESRDDACGAYLVLTNPDGPDLVDLQLDLYLFNPDQVIERRIAVNLAPLPTGKTSVKLFDIKDLNCSKVGKVLINGAISCASAEGPIANCVARIEPSSRVDAKFYK